MKHDIIETADATAIDRIPESCGEVTVGCSDVAGIVKSVIASSERLRAEHSALQGTVERLEADQQQVAQASDEARILSERAKDRLGEGTQLIQSSLIQISDILGMVEALGEHVTGFAAAMEQVRRVSQNIDAIARTTNMLALNAAIEAEKAGDAGKTFAVVASEVKTLARDTRAATDEIARTVGSLGIEAEQVIAKIEHGVKASAEAQASVERIDQSISGVAGLVDEVDSQNEAIARATGTINGHVLRVRDVLTDFDDAVAENNGQLATAHSRMGGLEMLSNEMFDTIVQAGFSPEDSVMVECARAAAAKAVALAEAAIASGGLSRAALFDHDYVEIAGSNPTRYRTGLMDWAHTHWRPLLDEVEGGDERIMAAACTDVNGYLPSHLSERSQPPTGDVVHDTAFCRNGRIILEAIDAKAKKSTAPYMMAVYRQEGDGRNYMVVRNVFVPMIVAGERWGDFEVAYSL